MFGLTGTFGTLVDLAVIAVGFGLIIFVHELGHFLAAKWAGIRVLAFAVGFGPAMVSYRKGLGFRRGSSEEEYHDRLDALAKDATTHEDKPARPSISPTEYRLNALPLGGYVKMLGQDDMDPGAVSAAADSYQSRPVWKRMVVISAGVVMNLVTAAVVFVGVFMVGLQVEPATVGIVSPGSPAAMAVASNGAALGVTEPGLRTGDRIVSIDGETPQSYSDVVLATAIAGPKQTLTFDVRREGVDGVLSFDIHPKKSETTGLLDVGVTPALSGEVAKWADWDQVVERYGLQGVEPGMELVRAGGREARWAADLTEASLRSGGQTFDVVFKDPETGHEVTVETTPRAELCEDFVDLNGTPTPIEHLLGLTGVLMVNPEAGEEDTAQGLKPGDIFARIGAVEFPSLVEGIREIRAHKGRRLQVVVLRGEGPVLERARVTLDVEVSRASGGRIGFAPDDTARHDALLALPPERVTDPTTDKSRTPPATRVIDVPGSRLVRVGETEVGDLPAVRTALVAQTQAAYESGASWADVELTLELPQASHPVVTRSWRLGRDDLERLHDLSWDSGIPLALFESEKTTLQAKGPVQAVSMGLHETKRVMLTTYLTFARLAQGTVKVEHLKGPVGIAHMGTLIAERGFVWVLFFLGLISVNLAVINFLPLPIVDGGQFLMLCYEGVRGKPVPIPVQNAVTMAGLVLIGSVFIIVTFNDVRALFGV
ncbi:MAG: site-2 protease family protein [Phycisphaerales bacterium]